jgi:hypothetical protein
MATAAGKTPTKPLAPAAATKTPTKPFAHMAARAAAKTPCSSRARFSHASENSHPNISGSPPPPSSTPSKSAKSPKAAGAKSASAKKKTSTPAPAAPPPPARVGERRFLVAKKGARRRRNVGRVGEFDFDKAREVLRASQEEFFCKERAASTAAKEQLHPDEEGNNEGKADEVDVKGGSLDVVQEESEPELEGSNKVRVLRTKAMAKAMSSVPDPASGRVKHLVHAFESLLTISGATSDAERAGEDSWALPGLLQPWKEEGKGDMGLPQPSVFSSADFLKAGPNRLCSSLDGNSDRLVDVVKKARQGNVLIFLASICSHRSLCLIVG